MALGNDTNDAVHPLICIVDEGLSFTQKHPWTALSASVLLGFLVGRLTGDRVITLAKKMASRIILRELETGVKFLIAGEGKD